MLQTGVSKQADAWSPVVFGCGLGVDDDVVREGVCVSGCDGGNVVFVAVHDANDLMRGLLQRLGHGTADLDDVLVLGQRHMCLYTAT